MFFKTKKDYESERLKGYFLGLFQPYENLPRLKEEITKMRKSHANLKSYKAYMDGFLSGYEDRRRTRLKELELVKKSLDKGLDRER